MIDLRVIFLQIIIVTFGEEVVKFSSMKFIQEM